MEDMNAEFGVREYARERKVSPPTASKILAGLHEKGLLRKREERRLLLFRANDESEYFRDLRKLFNIWILRESGLLDFLDRFYIKPTIILFGSMAKAENAASSDIDLCIISEKTAKADLAEFEKKLKRPIQIFPVRKLKELRNENLVENVLNGIVLRGKLRWI